LRKQASDALGRSISMDAYSLARNIATEVGSGTPEEKMAVALSTIGQARRRNTSVSSLVLLTTKGERKGTALYGPIHPKPTGENIHGRWTASTLDPTVRDVLIAEFALSGKAGDFARGADNQAHHSIISEQRLRENRWYWVGPIPGVNPRHTYLVTTRTDVDPDSPQGRQLLALSMEAKGGRYNLSNLTTVATAGGGGLGWFGWTLVYLVVGSALYYTGQAIRKKYA
jgi:hypothetical protein